MFLTLDRVFSMTSRSQFVNVDVAVDVAWENAAPCGGI